MIDPNGILFLIDSSSIYRGEQTYIYGYMYSTYILYMIYNREKKDKIKGQFQIRPFLVVLFQKRPPNIFYPNKATQ